VYNAGTEDDVDDWVGDAVEWCQALNEDGHRVLVPPSGGRQQSVRVE